MPFCQNASLHDNIRQRRIGGGGEKGNFTNLSNVDFPAPRKPQMMVKGTREGDSEMTSVASVSILVESATGQWCRRR